MTAIPEPTEDIEYAEDMLRSGCASSSSSAGRLLRVIAHYQRENERLARHIGRTADGICLIDCKEFYCPSCGSLLKSVSNGTWQSCRRCRKHWSRSEAMSKPNDFIDALSGEGGGV